MRDLLRNRGVYVPKGVGLNISIALHRVAHEKPPWPEDEDRSTPPAPQEKQQDDNLLEAEKKQKTKKAKVDHEVSTKEGRSNLSGDNSTYDKGKPGFITNLYKTYSSD